MNLKSLIFISFIFNLLIAKNSTDINLFNDMAKKSCQEKSSLIKTVFIGEPIEFTDHLVLIIKGEHSKNTPKNRKGIDICLYDKNTKTTSISEGFDIKNCQIVQKEDIKFHQTYKYGEDLTLLVSEGDDENKNMGSYCLKFYFYEIDLGDFVTGILRQRDGLIRGVEIKDLNGDKKDEIIVTLETDGSGKSFNVDVFNFDGKKITFNEDLSKSETEKINIDN